MISPIQTFGSALDSIQIFTVLDKLDAIVVLSRTNNLIFWKLNPDGRYRSCLTYQLNDKCKVFYASATKNPIQILVPINNGNISILNVGINLDKIINTSLIFDVHDKKAIIVCMDYDPISNLLITVGSDNKLVLSDIVNQEVITSTQCSYYRIAHILFDFDGKTIYYLPYKGPIYCFYVDLSKLIKIQNLKSIKINNKCASKMIIIENKYRIIVGFDDGEIHLYSTNPDDDCFLNLIFHKAKIVQLTMIKNNLMSNSIDGMICLWDLSLNREPVKYFQQHKFCELCLKPFFWNFKLMADKFKMFTKKNNCKICGLRLCNKHFSSPSTSLLHGLERPAKICKACSSEIRNDETYKTTSHNLGYNTPCVSYNYSQKQLFVQMGTNSVIEINASNFFENDENTSQGS